MLETTLQQHNDSTYKMSTCHQSLVSLYTNSFLFCEFYILFSLLCPLLNLWTKELFHGNLFHKCNWNKDFSVCYTDECSSKNINSNKYAWIYYRSTYLNLSKTCVCVCVCVWVCVYRKNDDENVVLAVRQRVKVLHLS